MLRAIAILFPPFGVWRRGRCPDGCNDGTPWPWCCGGVPARLKWWYALWGIGLLLLMMGCQEPGDDDDDDSNAPIIQKTPPLDDGDYLLLDPVQLWSGMRLDWGDLTVTDGDVFQANVHLSEDGGCHAVLSLRGDWLCVPCRYGRQTSGCGWAMYRPTDAWHCSDDYMSVVNGQLSDWWTYADGGVWLGHPCAGWTEFYETVEEESDDAY